MVVVASRRSPAGMVRFFLAAALLLIACIATVLAAATGDGSTICDTAKCGKGTCREVTIAPLVAGYNCTCDPGWSQPKLLNLSVLNWMPCMIPECSFDSSCYNFSFLWTLPKGIPLPPPIGDPCVAINCGSGDCKKGTGFNYTCECHPGYNNFLNLTMLPCMKNCAFGDDCSKLGLSPAGAPPPMPSAAAPAPGSASSWRLLQQLLSLPILLLLQVV